MNPPKSCLWRICLAIILLILGVLSYAFWRPKGLLNGTFDFNGGEIPSEISGSLPDALWYGSLLILQPRLKFRTPFFKGQLLTLAAISLPFIHEFLQYSSLVPGTGCYYDLLSYSVILLIYLSRCLILTKSNKSM